ncbi:hypothetical protein [Pontimonas sp.]|jgi:hypothetical protein|uniref:hypothetical protein n=1 Tax=Pontimonas sp. TaxID=2304492 RepID=UPI00287059A8|nr:hypothetical protein [Pontimonas sp.]MDR9396176.1 hypothetical protein [Pontimonas sp.]MDR9434533.1 hypothetical protein [Pontimonas sp.]
MELARNLTLIAHFIGLAMIIGPFLLHLRSRSGYPFNWVLAGTIVQLVTGLVLTGLAEMRLADDPDVAVDHIKIAVKTGVALVALTAALIGFLRQRGGLAGNERKLMPFFHTAGGLAFIDVFVAVLWPGVVMG